MLDFFLNAVQNFSKNYLYSKFDLFYIDTSLVQMRIDALVRS